MVLGALRGAGPESCDESLIAEDMALEDFVTTVSVAGKQCAWTPYGPDPAFSELELPPDGYVDLGRAFLSTVAFTRWVTAYAMAVVTVAENRAARLAVSSPDRVKVWVNGEQVLRLGQVDRDLLDDPFAAETVSVALRAGRNLILVKACEEGNEYGFFLRMTGENGHPLRW